MTNKPFYGCGCCGRESGEVQLWCPDCVGHVSKASDPWDRTYSAQFGKPCPFDSTDLDGIAQENGLAIREYPFKWKKAKAMAEQHSHPINPEIAMLRFVELGGVQDVLTASVISEGL